MQYRCVGNTGIEISALGFGTMRFKGPDNAAAIIEHGLPLGLTYFDIGAAYSFQDVENNAEVWVGNALKGRPREGLVLSAKAQPRPETGRLEANLGVNNRDAMWQCIEQSLQRVGVDRFDFYQFWDMSAPEHFSAACEGDDSPLQAMREAKEQGLLRELGFTSHAKPELIIEWMGRVPDFRFITVYHNFHDRAPELAIEHAHAHGIAVAIMGPLRGGLLVGSSEVFGRHLPELAGVPVQEIAFRYLLSSPAVTTVLSGMNEIEHLKENARVASLPEPMTAEQRARFLDAFEDFSHGEPLCTGCRYCAGACPEGLPVPEHMQAFNLKMIFGLSTIDGQLRDAHGHETNDPARCTACETCVEKCPQNLPIPDRMEKLAEIAEALAAAG